jgi:hypothetical protein
VSTSGVLAEENRRVAAPRFAEARNPPTGQGALSASASSRATAYAAIGPEQAPPPRQTASSSGAAAAAEASRSARIRVFGHVTDLSVLDTT